MTSPYQLFSINDIISISGGSPVHQVSGSISSVVIDSREVSEGALFVALEGERTDGHRYIAEAVKRGAVCVLADKSKEAVFPDTGDGAVIVKVDNTLSALWKLAGKFVERFPSLVRIGVTGSSGKTTTKEIIASILSNDSKTVFNRGNLNSDIGLPLSVFSIRPEHRYGVFEMGINYKGEMAVLAEVLRPEYAVITNIGTAHAGPLGGERGIAEEKSGIFAFFTKKSRAFLPEKDKYLSYLESACGERYVLFGSGRSSLLGETENLGLKGWRITYDGTEAVFSLPGEHNLENLYAAVAVAEYFNIGKDAVIRGIESVSALPGRGRVIAGEVTIIEDSYNANGDSVSRALDYLENLSVEGRKIAVLGSMKELGSESENIHRKIGLKVRDLSIDAVFFFGDETASAYEAAVGGGPDRFYFNNYEKLEDSIAGYIDRGDTVLLKGSRSMELERLVDTLTARKGRKNHV